MMVNAEDVDRGTLGHMIPRPYTPVRAQVIGVPPEFQDELDAVHFETGVPRSWIAAVCEMTAWDPFFVTYNLGPSGVESIRRFGIAGVSAFLPEWPRCFPLDGCNAAFRVCGGGWIFPGNICRFTCSVGPFGARYQDSIPALSLVRENMRFAAYILKDCAAVIEALCGEVTDLAFLRWQIGCNYQLFDDVTGNPICTLPPGLPNIFIQEKDKIIAAQRVYAEIFSEPIFGAPPLAVSLSANRTLVGPGGSVTFQANVQGGSGGNSFEWTFGDGGSDTTANPTVSHTYELVGAYQARVLVRDRVNATALSAPLLITVEEGAPTGGIPWWLIALGALGLVGLVGLSKKSKRQQAQEKRQAAQKLRAQAQTARLKGNAAQATQLESQASRLEQEATQLEQQATQEEALQRQLQQPPGR